MTLSIGYSPVIAIGNGTTRGFGYTFDEVSAEYLKVSFWINDKWVQQLSGWAKEANQRSITFDVAPENGLKIAIERDVPYSQEMPFFTSSGFQADVVENLFDKTVALAQQVKDITDRCFKTEVGGISPEELLEELLTGIEEVNQIAVELRSLVSTSTAEFNSLKQQTQEIKDETATYSAEAETYRDETKVVRDDVQQIKNDVENYGNTFKTSFYTKEEIDSMVGDVETLINAL